MIPIANQTRRGPALAVWALVAMNLYVFVKELNAADINAFIDSYAIIPFDITRGVQLPTAPHPQVLTLVSAMFLHGSFLHIFFNMLFLLVFGPAIARSLGSTGFLFFYLLCGLAGGFAQILAAPGSHIPEIGASGAIAGVLGAFIVRYPTDSIETIVPIGCFPLFLRLPAALVIGLWAVVQFIHGFGTLDARAGSEQGGVAYFAHIGGFLAGVLLFGLFPRRARGNWA